MDRNLFSNPFVVRFVASAESQSQMVPYVIWESENPTGHYWQNINSEFSPLSCWERLCAIPGRSWKTTFTTIFSSAYLEDYSAEYFETERLLLFKAYGPLLNARWYVDGVVQNAAVLQANIRYVEPGIGLAVIFNRIYRVEPEEKIPNSEGQCSWVYPPGEKAAFTWENEGERNGDAPLQFPGLYVIIYSKEEDRCR